MTIRFAELARAGPASLASKAGITDLPFRSLAVRQGAALVVSEMVARRVMIGRAARGRAGLGAQFAAGWRGRTPPSAPVRANLADLVAGHCVDILSLHGAGIGLRAARRHPGRYMDHATTPAAFRREMPTAETPGQVRSPIGHALAVRPLRGAA